MPVLPNCTINTSRPRHNATTGNTAAPSAYLTGIAGHASDVPTADLIRMGPTLDADIKVTVDLGTDILEGDIITAILNADGSAWLGTINNQNEELIVKKATNGSPLILPCRLIYIKRVIFGGVAV